MKKKEMWKVLGRDDYAHKSQELKKKCEELAKAICDNRNLHPSQWYYLQSYYRANKLY